MKITVLAGDGIGVEVTREAVKILNEVSAVFGIDLNIDNHLIGGAAIRKRGNPLPDETLDSCLNSDAVLLGAVGSPEFDELTPEMRPEAGLLRLRKALGGFANLRPAKAYNSLIDSSPLRPERFQDTDLLIVRELLGGLYFGEPRAFSSDGNEAFNTMRYSSDEIERVARVAFKAARSRKKRVTSVDKANVLETSQLWRKTVEKVSENYPDVELDHLFVDACAMHLVTNPRQFDVILTENLFGDILSDEAAVLTGSLGMLASATIGGKVGLYEPVHGSAPDIAGQNKANPLGAIGCVAMMFRYTAQNDEAADAVENAVDKVLKDGFRTSDMAGNHETSVLPTDEMGDIAANYAVENANISFAFHAV